VKILVVCDEGNNRSVTVAHHLKYWGHDVLTAGLKRNSMGTLNMLFDWADRVIYTEPDQFFTLSPSDQRKFQLWNLGPDTYPRPFNKDLLHKVRALMQEHREEYKP
jgi:hypothetical protein